ncbi:protein TsetseEP-like [Thrips palmi]|uniref:Protein TsetseEP-like n=1 Tax=Thrips palmi TaxID=161013 RepID=A0A6P8ZLE0_THRPL|nr:protein TsetseEP-like [Thrips palmi]
MRLLEQAESSLEERYLLDAAGLGHDLGHDQGIGPGYGFAIHSEHSDQYAERDDGSLAGLGHGLGEAHVEQSEIKPQYVKRVVVTKAVPYSVPQPYTVTVEKKVPYPVKVPVHVPVDKPYEVTVLKPYPVHVDRPVPYAVEKPVPYPVKVAVRVPVPQPVPYEVAKPYAVPVTVAKPYKVPVPVYVKAKEHGIKSEYPHVRYIPQYDPQPQPQPAPQPLPQPQPQPEYGVPSHGDDHHVGGYSEQRETYAAFSTSSSDLEARLADLREKGGSFSYVYRH